MREELTWQQLSVLRLLARKHKSSSGIDWDKVLADFEDALGFRPVFKEVH